MDTRTTGLNILFPMDKMSEDDPNVGRGLAVASLLGLGGGAGSYYGAPALSRGLLPAEQALYDAAQSHLGPEGSARAMARSAMKGGTGVDAERYARELLRQDEIASRLGRAQAGLGRLRGGLGSAKGRAIAAGLGGLGLGGLGYAIGD